jgi:hypothetical protein
MASEAEMIGSNEATQPETAIEEREGLPHATREQGKEITSPLSVLARFEEDKVAYIQFLEDSYGTAGSIKTGGVTRFHSDPSGKEVEV